MIHIGTSSMEYKVYVYNDAKTLITAGKNEKRLNYKMETI